MSTFLLALFNQRVGALLDPSRISHVWLVNYVLSKTYKRNVNIDTKVLDNFLTNGNKDILINEDDYLDDGLSILIVREPE